MQTMKLIQLTIEGCLAFFLLLCAAFLSLWREDDKRRSDTLTSLLLLGSVRLIADISENMFRVGTDPTFIMGKKICAFLIYSTSPMLAYSMSRYLNAVSVHRGGRGERTHAFAVKAISAVYMILIIMTQFNGWAYRIDAQNVYSRGPGYEVLVVMGGIQLLMLTAMVVHMRKDITLPEMIALMVYIAMPLVAAIYQTLHLGLSLTTTFMAVSLLFLFLTHEAEKTNRILKQEKMIWERNLEVAEQNEKIAQQQSALNDLRVQLLVSQIRPHFIFNSLGCIEQLCHMEPEKAAVAIHNFSKYVRRNLRAISSTEPVPFADELSHIRAYIWLEKMRFGEELEFVEDLQTTDFKLPCLSVQPLVENAVKHGLMGMEEGVLKVSLSTAETADAFRIVIADNGCGFDPAEAEEKKEGHIGLANVRERLQLRLNATMEVKSRPGEGTEITICIPKNSSV